MNKIVRRLQILLKAAEFSRIGNMAVKEAQERNRKLGLPNVFFRNGTIYYELPDGRITRKDPMKDIKEILRTQSKS